MLHRLRSSRSTAVLAAAAAGLVLAAPTAAFASASHYGTATHGHSRNFTLNEVPLVSDVPGLAPLTDPDLKNPWGVSLSPTSPLWVSNQGTDSSTLYSLAPGADTATKSSTVRVTMPDSVAGPSGQVFNPGTGFVISNGTVSASAAFIFATLDGHIEAWSPKVDPLIGNAQDVATVAGAGYTGLALAATKSGDELFAADFVTGKVDVFDSSFHQVTLAPWQFRDPRLPKGYLAFNTQALDGNIFVTYDTLNAHPAPGAGPEGLGRGVGIVDEFSTDGRLIARIATGGSLDAPWGLAIAPSSWGSVAGSLLVGNFGDGHINIYAKEGRHFADHATGRILVAATGKPFAEPGLWALLPGTATTGGTNALWFTAGIRTQPGGPREAGGLLGVLRP
jgi:uncharacterized protein (TIGR03118 family)